MRFRLPAASAMLCFSATLILSSPLTATISHAKRMNAVTAITYERTGGTDTVTVHLARLASYKSRFLEAHKHKGIPFRLYIDVLNAHLQHTADRHIVPPGWSLIQKIRSGQRNRSTARVVLEIKKEIFRDDYRISQTEHPAQIVIELFADERLLNRRTGPVSDAYSPGSSAEKAERTQTAGTTTAPPAQKKEQPEPRDAKPAAAAPAVQNRDNTCIIVIDPGHGGKDPGAIGYRGMKEKHVCLAIAKQLKKSLDRYPNCKTILTRTKDVFLSLEKRAEIANKSNADLFISVHANSHTDPSLSGVETYYLNFSSDSSARRVAARENFTTPSQISDLELILFDLMHNEKINRSSILAGYIHNNIVDAVSRRYSTFRNLGVKHAPMRVLIDAEMPGVLLETAFISNPSEAKRLTSRAYQSSIAAAVAKGIHSFINGEKTVLYINKN